MKFELPTSSSPEQIQDLLHRFARLAGAHLSESESGEVPVYQAHTPEELRATIEMRPRDEGRNLEELFEELDKILKLSVRTSHPRFANHLFVGSDLSGILGEWVTALLDSTMATYEMSSVSTVMERELIAEMCDLAGFDGGEGLFTPGGSISNLMAVAVARDHYFPNARVRGMAGEELPAIFTSSEAHYSLSRAANILGLGLDSIFPVDVDEVGRILPQSLKEEIEKARAMGRKPFFVCATAGTTVACAYDPIDEIAEICAQEDLWLHVDGAYGGAVLLSQKHQGLMKGIEKADSMTWCPHKMMGVPVVCSAFLARRQGQLQSALAVDADYIFHPGMETLNLGPMSLQCGRRIDAIKVWMAWQFRGRRGMEEQIDRFFDQAQFFADQIRSRPHFELLREPEGANIVFHYIPPALRDQPEGEERKEALDKATRKIREAVKERGEVLVNYGPIDGYASFRMVTINPRTTEEDLLAFLDEIQEAGDALYPAIDAHVELKVS